MTGRIPGASGAGVDCRVVHASSSPPAPAAWRRPAFYGRVAQFLAGLAGMGLGIATMLDAGVGVGPWAVFHDGVARVTPLTFGQALMAVGVAVLILAWTWTGERPGPGTFVNMLVVGPTVDLVRASGWLPVQETLLLGTAQALVGVAIIGFASAVYITARFGAGPRDAFMLGLSRRTGWSIRRTRTTLELVVLAIGVALGGSAGLGTVLFAVTIGVSMQASLRLLSSRGR
jgi:uncharacterized membrane protein YczE